MSPKPNFTKMLTDPCHLTKIHENLEITKSAGESSDENVVFLQGKDNEHQISPKPNSTKTLTDLGHLMEISENLEILETGWTV